MSAERLNCDSLGCVESHPLDHELVGQPSFGTGRWLGWVYLDLNQPLLFQRPLRFCSVFCCARWLEMASYNGGRLNRPPTNLDIALGNPDDALARKRAGIKGGAA